jgi:anaerobic selenocysteine-containing dehydrogenase
LFSEYPGHQYHDGNLWQCWRAWGSGFLKSSALFETSQILYAQRVSPTPFRGGEHGIQNGNDERLHTSQAFLSAVLEEKPYPIKAAMGILTDPMMSYPDSERVYRTFQKLDLLVMAEIFPTPSTAMADFVLPVAWGAEHDTVGLTRWR